MQLGVSLEPDQVARLDAYVEALRKWNSTFNFISRRDVPRLVPRHILDALTGVGLLRGQHILDLGSGAGLPGLVLAIAAPERSFTLADRSERRMRFCTQMIRELALDNVQTWVGDLSARHFPAMRFDTVTARGVATPLLVWDMVLPILNSPGRALIYAATGSGLAEEPAVELPVTEDVDVSIHDFAIPQLDSLHRLVCLDHA